MKLLAENILYVSEDGQADWTSAAWLHFSCNFCPCGAWANQERHVPWLYAGCNRVWGYFCQQGFLLWAAWRPGLSHAEIKVWQSCGIFLLCIPKTPRGWGAAGRAVHLYSSL